MSTPSGYAGWAEARNLDPTHPEHWPAATHTAYRRWCVGRWKAHWRWFLEIGQMALMAKAHGWPYVKHEMRKEYRDAITPLLGNPWRGRMQDVPRSSPWKPAPLLPIEEATLAAQGAQISQNPRHSRATLIALANIASFGRRMK